MTRQLLTFSRKQTIQTCDIDANEVVKNMSKLLRGLAAGYGAKKLGGGCFSTVLIFILLWWLLGNFDIFK